MSDPNIHQLFAAALIAVGTVSFCLSMWFLFARSRRNAADAEMRSAWEQSMKTAEMPTYDGDTYAYNGWTPDTLALYLRDPNPTRGDLPVLKDLPTEYTPKHAVPPSEVSGPLPTQPFDPCYDPAADAESYIQMMKDKTAAFIASMTK